jgi:hypothetical protein
MLRSLTLSSIALFLSTTVIAQENYSTPGTKEVYWTGSGEWIFSAPILDVNGSDQGAVVRFSGFFNVQSMLNYDLSNSFGLFTGLSIRNQGFIYQVPDTSLRYKFRTYNVGIPVGIKLGNMNKNLVYLGYEIELPFNYKEKRFENEKKEDKFNVWFSDRNAPFYQSVFLGFQGPGSTSLTVRYYLTNFHNPDFEETKDGVTYKPYDGLNANLLTVSLGFGLFDGTALEKTINKEIGDPQAFRR